MHHFSFLSLRKTNTFSIIRTLILVFLSLAYSSAAFGWCNTVYIEERYPATGTTYSDPATINAAAYVSYSPNPAAQCPVFFQLRHAGTTQVAYESSVSFKAYSATYNTQFTGVTDGLYDLFVFLRTGIWGDIGKVTAYSIKVGNGTRWYDSSGGSGNISDPNHDDPVNLATGEESYSPGLSLAAHNPDGPIAAFSLNYLATLAKADAYSPGLSPGWMHELDYSIQGEYASYWTTLTFYSSGGGTEVLTPETNDQGTPTGQFLVPTAAPYRITGTPSTTMNVWQSISMQKADGVTWVFTPHSCGRYVLSQATDSLGNCLTFTWDTARRLTAIKNGDGTISLLTFSYDTNGNLAAITDVQASRKVTCGFTTPTGFAFRCLTSISQIAATSEATPPDRLVYGYYAYNGDALLSTISQPSPTQTGMSTISLTYNATTGRVVSQTDENGNQSVYTYNTSSTQVTVKDSADNTVQTWTQHFDERGRDIGIEDVENHRTTIEYEDARFPTKPTKVIDKDGKFVTKTYDDHGNTLTVTDMRGTTVNYTYDYSTWFAGRLVKTQIVGKTPTTYTYLEPSGLTKTITRPRPGSTGGATVTTAMTYDLEQNSAVHFGRFVRLESPGNEAVSTIVTTNTYNYTDDAQYDANGDPGTFHLNQSLGLPLTITNKKGQTTHLRYDAMGNITTMITPDGLRTDTSYNLAGQPLEVMMLAETLGGGRRKVVTDYMYPGGPSWRTTYYDTDGTTVLRREVTTYDAAGMVVGQSGGEEEATYQYDALLRMVALTDAKDQTTNYSYDNCGRLTQVMRPGGQTNRYTSFDDAGRVLTAIDGNGVTTTYAYDSEGMLTSIDYSSTTGVDIAYQYNNDGSLQSREDCEGTEAYTYDITGNPLAITMTYTGLPANTISYTYNPNGSRRTMSSPAGSYRYSYNTDGQLVAERNPAGRVARWTYRATDGELTRQTLGNRAWTDYAYDTVGRLARLTHKSPKGRVLAEYAIDGRDAFDNINEVTATLPGCPEFSGLRQYSYGEKRQLAQEQWTPRIGENGFTQTTVYDATGNPTQFPRELPGYEGLARAYNSNDQWNGYRDAQDNLVGTNLFVYDDNGNPTTYKGTSLTYDVANHLTAYGTVMTAGYTADGLRAWKETNGQRQYFLYDGTQLICELNADGDVTSYNTWGPTGLLARTDVLFSIETWYAFDAEENVALRLSNTGIVKSEDVYDAWGTLIYGGNTNDPYGYQGQAGYYTDHETGLILCTFRYFDPSSGRFLTCDPVGMIGGINLYRYCGNNPVNMNDPLGLWTLWIDGSPFLTFDKETVGEGLKVGTSAVAESFSYGLFKTDPSTQKDPDYKVSKFLADISREALMAALTSGAGSGGGVAASKGASGFVAASEGANGIRTGSNVVYRSVNAADDVQYVGITNNYLRREGEHLATKGIQIEKIPGLTQLSRSDARAVEQVLIELHGLGKNGGTLLNKINSIAKSNKNNIYENSLRRGMEILQKVGYPGI